jgi:lipopolysaccharide export LptBFGC system permease protein LptF
MLNNEILKFEKRRLNNLKIVLKEKRNEFKIISSSNKKLHESNKKNIAFEENKLKRYDRNFLEGERRTIIKRFIELKTNVNLLESIAYDEIQTINTRLQDSDLNFYNIVKEVKKNIL